MWLADAEGTKKFLRRRRQRQALIHHTSPLIYKTTSIFTRFIGNEYSENKPEFQAFILPSLQREAGARETRSLGMERGSGAEREEEREPDTKRVISCVI